MGRPSFSSAWAAFMAVNVSVPEVGRKIGGRVQQNIEMPRGFENACPIRMSYVLNTTGFPIPKSVAFAMVSGADKRQYIYRVEDLHRYLERAFGKPDIVAQPEPQAFSGKRGILVVKGGGWVGASGHVTLWDGERCSDSCHLARNPDNGTFIPTSAALWVLQ